MEPIKLEFIIKGEIEKELAKVKLAIKGVGDESYTSFKRLLNSSGEAFSGLSHVAREQAVALQRVIQDLMQNEAAQEALFESFEKGSVSASDYAQAQARLSTQQADLKQQASELNKELQNEIVLNDKASDSLQQKTATLANLKAEYARLTGEERDNEQIGGQLITRIQDLDREVTSIGNGMNDTKTKSAALMDALELIPGPIGVGVSKLKQFLTVGKSLMSSGIGLFVGGLAATFYALKTGIEGSSKATTQLAAKSEYFKSLFGTQKKMLTEGMAAFWNMITGDTPALNNNIQTLLRLQIFQRLYAKMAEQSVIQQKKANELEERNKGLITTNTSAIEQYRLGMMDVNKTLEERKALSREILKLEKENSQFKLDVISEKYKAFILNGAEGMERASKQFPEQTKLAQEYFKTLTDGGQLTLTQQHELIHSINDITNGLDRGWTKEEKVEFGSLFYEALDVNQDYYSKSDEINNIIRQQANEAAQANKKVTLENLQEEVRLHKEQYAIMHAFERNMGKEAADEAFNDLKAKGDDFMAYLTNKINELQNKPHRTKDENIMLGWLQQTHQEATPQYDTSAFKQSLEEKKKLYKEDLDSYLAYLEKLRTQTNQDTSNAGKQKSIIIDLEIKGGKEEQQKQLDDLVKNYQTFTVKMSSLEKSYQHDMARLGSAYQNATTEEDKKRYGEAMEARTNAYQVGLAGLMAENSEFTQILFGDMNKVSRATLNNGIKEAKKFVDDWKQNFGTLTPEMQAFLKRYEEGIKSAEDKKRNKTPEGLRATATALQECANMAALFDSTLSNVLQNTANLANAAASIATGIAQIATQNYIQGAASIISGMSSFISGIGKRVEENKKIREEYLQGILETADKELEYNSILRDRLRTQQQIGETSLQYFSRLREELKKQKSSTNTEYNEVWSKLMGEQYISQTNYRHGTWFRKAKTWNDYESLSGKSYEDIEKLYTQDKLEGAAKTLFERLKQLKEEGTEVVEMMDQLNQEIQEAWTGTTASAISDSIVQGFIDGKKSAADFADDFKGLMRDAMMKSIEMKYLEAPLQKWYEKFAKDSESGLTSDKIEQLRNQYNQIIETAAREAENLEKITGIGMATSDAQRTAEAKGLQAMSQESANELNGRFYALQYITANIDNNVTDIQMLLYRAAEKWIQIEENTRYCRRLEEIEMYMKEMKNGISIMVNNGILMRKQ